MSDETSEAGWSSSRRMERKFESGEWAKSVACMPDILKTQFSKSRSNFIERENEEEDNEC